MTSSTTTVQDKILTSSFSVSDLTLETIRSLEPQVRMVDSDNSIKLFCYTSCSEDDPDSVKACRGIVFDDDKLILKPFSYTPEYTAKEKDKISACLPSSLESCRIFDSHEGVLIRCFHAQGKWYTSTHRRLDAFRSKWASRTSFGEAFTEALRSAERNSLPFREYLERHTTNDDDETEQSILDTFLSTLDTSKQYMFLVENDRENRIVCESVESPYVFHVGTLTDGEFELTTSVGLPNPNEHELTSLDELLAFVETMDERYLQGVIVFTPNGEVKITSSKYDYFFKLRGNEPSIKYRYLQLRMSMTEAADFKNLYPEYVKDFEKYEDTLYDVMTYIKDAYIKRYIKKEYVTMPPEEFSIMREIHKWHIEDRANHHISSNKVIDVLNEQPPSKINKIVRRYLNEERLKNVAVAEE